METKIGYMLLAPRYRDAEADGKWMQEFGCTEIVREEPAKGRKRAKAWNQLLARLHVGDTIVVPKLCNAISGARQLVCFLELCHRRGIRFVSIHDRIDSAGELFPDTKAADVLTAIALLPKEANRLRRLLRPARERNEKEKEKVKSAFETKREKRSRMIVEKYLAGTPTEEIFKLSGFKSRSSVFRVLREAQVECNRVRVDGRPKPKRETAKRDERNRLVAQMYREGASLDEIHRISGFRSRSSVFRVLRDAGVKLNRGDQRGRRRKE